MPLFIHWNPDIVALDLGFLAIRWYSLCWVLALGGGYLVVQRLYRHQGIPDEKFDPLFIYCFIGIIAGARLGHCLFYEPGYFLSHPIEMLLPIRQAVDGWHFTGYEGLASHGGTLGLIIALWLYNRKYQVGLWTILDNIAIATPIAACFIRLGNLMNSEIIGRPTDVPWAFVFERVDMLPRHPGQLYEAIVYLVLFFVGLAIYARWNGRKLVGTGWYFGWCIFAIFTSRIFIEYTKEVQEAFEEGMLFNMGQLLSVPFVLLGAYCMYKGWQKR
ncbi:MAG: prolipoprotein diacylglyceryl transferase [Bacteroidaceae bacterium]|nr:prolipoprotein diacylglyceryl transferase [Bacteroidaceae bacterium]